MTTTTTDPAATQTAEPAQMTQVEPADLGDPGKKALSEERAARRAAEKQANELKTQLDALNRANETALEKAQREATEAAQRESAATAEALRWRIAAKHGITDEDAETFLTGTDEATLTRQAKRLAALSTTASTTTQPGPRPDLTQGGKPAAGTSSPEQDFANFLQNALPGR